jgi:hypothetical protein
VYEVEDLSSGRVTSIHASRLQFYSDASLNVSTDLLAHIAHNNQGFDVRDLLDVRYDAESKSYCVLVSWLGFENADNTGEPLANLLQDIPHLVSRFLDKISDQDLAAALREECNLRPTLWLRSRLSPERKCGGSTTMEYGIPVSL